MKIKNNIVPVILSGGIGSRLWPLSQPEKPKQFAVIVDGHTLFQNTILRLQNISGLSAPIIICNKNYRTLVNSQLKQIKANSKDFILEPSGRNTAPAITIAAMYALQKLKNPLLLVLPADHAIKDQAKFRRSINTAKKLAEKELLVTFGIPPNRPETGYGYIKFSKKLINKAYSIDKFIEKPNLNLAKKYFKSGNYWWNSGMFMFKAETFLQEIKASAPEIFASCDRAFTAASKNKNLILLPTKEFTSCPSNSIDYAVMEKTKRGAVVELKAGWSDIGSWLSLWQYVAKDANGNVISGKPIIQSTKNSYIQATKHKLVVLGISDCIVVETENAILVCHKDSGQDLRKVVN